MNLEEQVKQMLDELKLDDALASIDNFVDEKFKD